jgi:hypothetical protein
MSDPAGVRPKGTLSRIAPDWFADNLYSIAWYDIEVPVVNFTQFGAFGIFNNDIQGRVARVYGITVGSSAGGGSMLFWQHGTIGAQVTTAQAIRPDYPAPLVTGWNLDLSIPRTTPVVFPFNFGPGFGMIGNSGFDSATSISNFPLAIIPVGWSLVISQPQAGPPFSYGAWFQMCNR